MASVILYQIPQVIQTTQAGSVGVNSATNKIDFDISKNVTTEVEFLLKNIDRKLINDPDITLIMYLVNTITNSLILQRTLNKKGIGHYRLSVFPSDLFDIDPGYYSYSVVIQRLDQSQILVHSTQNRAQYGYMEVKKGPLPSPIPPEIWIPTDFNKRMSLNPIQNYVVSDSYMGSAQRDNRPGQHTAAIYTKNFTGSLKIQACLDNSAPTSDLAWFDLPETNTMFIDNTGVTSIQFVGSYMWVRFSYTPDPTNVGTLTQILFKN